MFKARNNMRPNNIQNLFKNREKNIEENATESSHVFSALLKAGAFVE